LGITSWKTSPKLAETYRSRSVSHAFLAGDAAHSFPPTGGLGLNTGIGDVHNLIWKISAVEKGWVTDSFLDTFTSERRAVAKTNSQQSKKNEETTFRLVSTFFRPDASPDDLWADPESRKHIQNAIRDQADHFDALNLVLGYVYGRENTRGPSDYQKENVPGARLPHEWVETSSGSRVSTLDLVDGYDFVLFTSPNLTTETKLDIKGVPVSVVQLSRDFKDPVGEWTEILGLTGTAAVLVRPDQHIVGTVNSMGEVSDLLQRYWSLT
jgi:2,4-dichlorophenol 6-monooxygenase